MIRLRNYQSAAADRLREKARSGLRRLVLISPTGCHAAGQQILMFGGRAQAVEDILVGERLMGPDGTPRTVLQLCRGRAPMFRIVPTKGDSFVVNSDHVLSLVRTQDGSRYAGQIVDVTVREWLGWNATMKHVHKLFRVGVDFPCPSMLSIDPYFLGVLLGDGSLRSTIGVCKPDPEIKAAVHREATRWGLAVSLDGAGTTSETQKLVGRQGRPNPLVNALRAMGLHGSDSGTKFIPFEFKTSTRAERMELLAGLLDTDGCLTVGGYDFISKSQALSEDLAFVARSLGLAAYISPCEKRCQTGAVGTYYRVSISGDCSEIPCRIPRRMAPPRRQIKSVLRTGFDVETLPEADFFGFVVDEDHRYLMGDFTVTHNSGKTVIFCSMVQGAVKLGKRVIVIAHRKELIDQTVKKLDAFGIRAGVMMGQDPRRDSRLAVQVCSIQTLSRRLDRLPPADLVVYDEVHHALSNTSRAVLEMYPDAIILGATATPWRTDKLGLADIFDDHVVAATPRQLIESGDLVSYEPFAYYAPDLDQVNVVAGEYNQRQLGVACNTDVLVGSVVREYVQHAAGRPALVFPVGIDNSHKIVQRFRDEGFRAEHLDCNTPKRERERIIEGLRSREVTIVSSVGVLTEGFDAPGAEVCILARPTLSLTLYMQMVGRVLRPSPETGKRGALIHDHAGNILRHGFPDDERDYSLLATKPYVEERHTCPFCKVIYSQRAPDGTCPRCNMLIALAESSAAGQGGGGGDREEKREVEGVRLDREAILALRSKLGRPDLSDAEAQRVATATPRQKAAEFLRLRGIAERKRFKTGWVSYQYKQTFGAWPNFSDQMLSSVNPSSHPFISPPPKRAPEDSHAP